MTAGIATIIVSIVAIMASGISIYVALYVKTIFGPIAERVEMHTEQHEANRRDHTQLWTNQRETESKLSRLRGEHDVCMAAGGHKKKGGN